MTSSYASVCDVGKHYPACRCACAMEIAAAEQDLAAMIQCFQEMRDSQ